MTEDMEEGYKLYYQIVDEPEYEMVSRNEVEKWPTDDENRDSSNYNRDSFGAAASSENDPRTNLFEDTDQKYEATRVLYVKPGYEEILGISNPTNEHGNSGELNLSESQWSTTERTYVRTFIFILTI